MSEGLNKRCRTFSSRIFVSADRATAARQMYIVFKKTFFYYWRQQSITYKINLTLLAISSETSFHYRQSET